jgi:Inner membrane protein CreD
MDVRTNQQDAKLKSEVGKLWGTVHRQCAPEVYFMYQGIRQPFPLSRSKINVDLKLDHRRRGLLWYSTFAVNFDGRYTIQNPFDEPTEIFIEFSLPAQGAVYDSFRFVLNGRELQNIQIATNTLTQRLELAAHESQPLQVTYRSQGMDEWWYDFGKDVTQVKDFDLTMKTDFDDVNFPGNSVSPSSKKHLDHGWQLQWKYSNLLSGVTIGMAMPHKLNPGPWVSRVTASAPVSLFLFFFLLFILTTIRKIKLHPMNYFFLGASFFSFHLLLAYLVDHLSIHFAFLLCSSVSIALVLSYMKLVVGRTRAFVEIAIAQFVYLVLFSYTFFFEEYAGLAITVLCILTLFVLMQVTGKLDWDHLFRRSASVQPVSSRRACPYCKGTLEASETFRCGRCNTAHHALCWSDHGGCAIYGCS